MDATKWFEQAMKQYEYAQCERHRIDALLERLGKGQGRRWERWLEWLVRGAATRIGFASPLTTAGVWYTKLLDLDGDQLATLPGAGHAKAKATIQRRLGEANKALESAFGDDVDIDASEPLARNEQALRCLSAIAEGDRRRIVFAASMAAGDPEQGWAMMDRAANRIDPDGAPERHRRAPPTTPGADPMGVPTSDERRLRRLAEQGRPDAVRTLDRGTRPRGAVSRAWAERGPHR